MFFVVCFWLCVFGLIEARRLASVQTCVIKGLRVCRLVKEARLWLAQRYHSDLTAEQIGFDPILRVQGVVCVCVFVFVLCLFVVVLIVWSVD